MKQSLIAWVLTHSQKNNDAKKSGVDVRLTVTNLDSTGPGTVIGRLGDLGFLPGEEILFFGSAPLGEPIYICVRETVVALRFEEAQLVCVTEAGGG